MMRGLTRGDRANAECLHGGCAGVLCKGARMADNLPWVLQLLEADRKLKRFQEVLAVIAGLEPQLNAMDPDRALAVLQRSQGPRALPLRMPTCGERKVDDGV